MNLQPNEVNELVALDKKVCEDYLQAFVDAAWEILEPDKELLWNWHHDLICEYLEALHGGDIRRLIINIPPRYTKPVELNSKVLTENGARKPLSEVMVGDKVLTHKGRFRRVIKKINQGSLKCLRIKTWHGRELICTSDHPVLTPHGWKQAGDLTEKELLGVPVPNDIAESNKPDEAFRLAGYFIGDGNTSPAGSSCASNITCYDGRMGQDIVNCARILGFGVTISVDGKRFNITNGVRDWLREIGLAGHTSRTKRVPQFIFNGSKSQIGQFVGAYFDCDGMISAKEKYRKDMWFSWTSVNRYLLSDVQHLLIRLGVRSRIRERIHNNNDWVPKGYKYYMLEVSSQDDCDRLRQYIECRGDKAQRIKSWDVRRQRFDESILLDAIISIENGGEKECACLEVEQDHSFTANDIAVHNSILVSVLFPAWAWIQDPRLRFIFASYSGSLSTKHSVDRRTVIESQWYQNQWGDRVRLSTDQNVKTEFTNDKRGHMIATSMLGTVTGRGGDCCSASTNILTESGDEVPIAEFENRIGTKVWSMNPNGELELATVVAWRKVLTNETIDIQTNSGNRIRCTPDHRIMSKKSGFKSAELLRPGIDKAICVQNVCQMRSPKIKEWHGLLGVLQNYFVSKSIAELSQLWKEVRKGAIQLSQVHNERLYQFLLFREMFLVASLQKKKAMPCLWGISPGSAYEILFSWLQTKGHCPNEKEGLSWPELHCGIPRNQTNCFEARWLQMYEMWDPSEIQKDTSCWSQASVKPYSSSQKPRYTRQQNEELTNDVPAMSCQSPQVLWSGIESINRTRKNEYVYDIQVAGNRNFFANGILVHNCVIIDDPHDPKIAQSETQRKTTIDAFKRTFTTRIDDKRKGRMVVVMQRLHQDDLTGYLLEHGGWEHLCVPAEADSKQTVVFPLSDRKIIRNHGDILHPEREGPKEISQQKRDLGSYEYAAQYQQAPAPKEGGIVKRGWWKFYKSIPAGIEQQILVCDASFKETKSGSFVVIQAWGRKGSNAYLLDQLRKRMDFPSTLISLKSMAAKWPRANAKLIEERANGAAIISMLRNELSGIIALNPKESKEARLSAVSPQIEAGNVWLPDPSIAEWVEDFMLEFDLFPNGKYDDQVDGTAYALMKLLHRSQELSNVELISMTRSSPWLK